MNTSFKKWPAIGLSLCALLLLNACKSSLEKIEDYQTDNPTVVTDDITQLTAPAGFQFNSSEEVELDLGAVLNEDGDLMQNVQMSLWTTDEKLNPIHLATGITDETGYWRLGLQVPIDRDSLDLVINTPGFALYHRIGVEGGRRITYNVGADENTTGRVVEEEVPADEENPNGARGGELSSRATMSYLGSYNRRGVPSYLTSPGPVDDDVLDFIAANLPEKPGVPEGNPHFLDPEMQGSVLFRNEGELWLTFAHEGAGYRNAVGYYTYPIDNPPRQKSDIDKHTIVFPNVSFRGSGGGLRSGNRVYLGKIPANTGVGFFLVPNGWNSRYRRVYDRWNTRYTIDELNTFTNTASRKHSVLLANSPREFLVLGFEDLNRPGGDNDFNDAVFIVEPTPWNAIITDYTPKVTLPGDDQDGDGVLDNQDLYPEDAQRAFAIHTPAEGEFGTVAYEDMWPRIGDYDFNDLVVDYNFIETLNADREVKDIQMDIRVRAIGASQNHGFALHLPNDPALIEKVVGQVLENNSYVPVGSNGVETGLKTSVIPIFTDGFSIFNESRGIINTDPTKPALDDGMLSIKITFRSAQDRNFIGTPPYDPFMLRSQDRSREIHLAGYAPTPKADLSMFNTEADASDLAKGFYYVDDKNMPWAITLPAQFKYPQEKVAINKVYTNFSSWATYGGTTARQWFRNTGGNIDEGKSY